MKNPNNQILILLEKFEKGEASEQELDELDKWYGSFENDIRYTSGLSEIQKMQAKKSLFLKINKQLAPDQISAKVYPLKKHLELWPRLAAAAVLVIGLFVGGYFLSHKPGATQQTAQNRPADIVPGGNKAFLTLANGKKISLTDAKTGEVAKQPGIKVTKTANGQLVYSATDQVFLPETGLGFNTVETPRGGQYHISLPDGTEVWLNAASSLKYPVSFGKSKERKVLLTGEAYFEVAHNKQHPFLVQTYRQTVTVLGTHFNVNAYADEPAIKTSLLQGSVSINAGSDYAIIKPGQQAVLGPLNLKVAPVDMDDAIAWKNGMFQFSDESLESIMRKISRWYNVDIEYADNDVKALPLTGIITHFSNISKVLHMLELTKQVHFKIEGRKIIVLK